MRSAYGVLYADRRLDQMFCLRHDLMSSSALLIGLRPNVSVIYCSTLGLRNAGSVGPR